MSNPSSEAKKSSQLPIQNTTSSNEIDDDEPDDWDKRIFSTGCSAENMKLTDCYYEKKDWRACKDEMQVFKECWKRHGNVQRTSMKDEPGSAK